jgi:repressor LexA
MTNVVLTETQAEVLSFMRTYRAEHQMNPTRVEIQEFFGWASANAAEDILKRMEKAGAIRLIRGRSRGIIDLETA